MTNARIFFAGVATTILLIGVGFGGGLMMAKTTMEPAAPSRTTAAERLPPARVIIPASVEAAPAPTPPAAPMETAQTPTPQLQANKGPETNISAPSERDKEAERAEKKKADAAEREHRKRVAERKARREAARLAKQQQERAPIMAFDGDEPPRMTNFFGN